MTKVVIGCILIFFFILGLVIIYNGTGDAGSFITGGLILFVLPGLTLIYLGLRDRIRKLAIPFKIIFGGLLIFFFFMGLVSSYDEGRDVGEYIGGGMILFVVPGVALIYFGIRDRRRKQGLSTWGESIGENFGERKFVPAGYFECKPPSGDGLCSDNACPCPEDTIPRGKGYLFIDKQLVAFRAMYPAEKDADEAMQAQIRGISRGGLVGGFYQTGPILMCERGARLRNLDLAVASADAAHWWETGTVPLRATPLTR